MVPRFAAAAAAALALALSSTQDVEAVVSKEVFFDKQPKVFAAPRTVVIHDPAIEVKSTYSKLLKSLEKRGHTVTFESIENRELQLFKYNEKLFENIVLLPGDKGLPSKEEPKPTYKVTQEEIKMGLTAAKPRPFSLTILLEFVDEGGNVMLATSPTKITRDIRKFANECGIDFLRDDSRVLDYFNGGEGGKIYGVTRREQPVTAAAKKVLYKGFAHAVANTPLTFSLLSGSATAYTVANKKDLLQPLTDGPLAAGSDVNLVSAMQARNSARVVVMGSDLVCSDELIGMEKAGNKQFCEDVTRWNFLEKNVLRMSNQTSYKVGEDHIGTPYMYRITDEIIFKIDIEEYDGKDKKWKPYIRDDIQLEFVMLDPHIRTYLTPPTKGSGSSTYTKQFKSPDVYGVFKFKILHSRVGYNALHLEELAPLRNFKHNDYERFIWCATPYYCSCLLVPLSVLLFSLRFLYHQEGKGSKPIPMM